ncbi:MAG: LytTR family DNA-binding domain-containing protein [Sutterellaceae bacterium]|nr:LytTR family DNA-binding domain-containing protein [Burkholderiaceae bacterium]MCX7902439.1 LytTR family DNA-binding domain-containing protein [Burkholderiaceae bacterium]MDW8430534.1 LytTR family DNA-binding domain-containing protein [Sutterellaceae bacterium]
MLKVLIVDDEPPARTRLQQLLADAATQMPLTVAGVADSGPAAIEVVQRLAPDVVLLDIQMPGMSGLEVARHLAARAQPPAVVFVTAYDEHALEAFEVQALDYLLKPVRLERLVAALARAQRLRPHEPKLEEVARALASARTHLTVSERGRMILVPVQDIVYLRAELKYVTIRTAQREYLTEESLSSLEAEFRERFVRIHRNALVARKSILGFQRVRTGSEAGAEGHWEVLLKELPERLPISRRQWPIVKSVLRDPVLAAQ